MRKTEDELAGLLERCASREQNALELLYDKVAPLLQTIAMRVL